MLEKIKMKLIYNKYFRMLFQPMYHSYRNLMNMKKSYIFKQTAVEALEQIQDAFNNKNIIYWLEFGTLLGAVREKKFISHDLDIDIGLFISEDHQRITNLLSQVGFRKVRSISIDNGKYGLEETYNYKGLFIDFFYFTQKEKEMYCHVFSNEYGKSWNQTIKEKGGLIVYEHTFPYDGFKEIIFLNKKVLIPNNEHEHLIAQYGDTYMIKNKKWNPYKMAPNKNILDNKVGVVENYE